jgi:hypothetical protein
MIGERGIPMGPDQPTPEAELYQENCLPLQSFSSPAIPVTPDTPLEPRRGRPAPDGQDAGKVPGGNEEDEAAAAAYTAAAAAAAAFAGPIVVAVRQALGAVLEAALRKPDEGQAGVGGAATSAPPAGRP